MQIENNDLFKRSKQSALQLVFSRVGVILVILLLQVGLLIALFSYVTTNYVHFYYG